jgi:hypothetical protein
MQIYANIFSIPFKPNPREIHRKEHCLFALAPCHFICGCSNPLCVFFSGMVLVRTELGQLVMVPQQALAQAQAQNNLSPRPSTPTTGPSFRAPGPQVGPIARPLLQQLRLVQRSLVKSLP